VHQGNRHSTVHNKPEGHAAAYVRGRGVHLLRSASRRVVPWGRGGSGLRGSHTKHQSKSRTTQEPGGRRVAATGRRHDGEIGRPVAVLGRNADASQQVPGQCGECQGCTTEHGHSADFIFGNCVTGEPSREASG
jgi:hypothetical protein